MKIDKYTYELPDSLIASYPTANRSDSRMLMLDRDSGDIQHKNFIDIIAALDPGDLLVFNNTRVIPARLYGHKETGGRVEVLVERILSQNRALAHIRSSKSPKPGRKLLLEDALSVTVVGREGDLFEIQFDDTNRDILTMLEQYGHIPLPPYIQRESQDQDKERYQTVYAKTPGAVAAPTAGLHFDEAIIASLEHKGVNTAYVTLHVGAGTFQPVKVDNITEHKMHSEWIEVSANVCHAIQQTRARGGRVVAVGTTVVRCLETASQTGGLTPYTGETSIFIYPGYDFKSVDGLITNFHLPRSTLLMLVSAFADIENVLHAYHIAVEKKYRFFSYGDVMLIL